MPIHRLHCSQD